MKLRKHTKKVIVDKEDSINLDELKNQNDITFILVTQDDEVIKRVTKVIVEFHEENKDKNINVVISSSYDKLHRLSGGVF